MSKLEMKYFVLKPRAKAFDDIYATASQRAMQAYADCLEEAGVDPKFRKAVRDWSVKETIAQARLSKRAWSNKRGNG